MMTYDPKKLDHFGNPDLAAFWRMAEANARKRLSNWIVPARFGRWMLFIPAIVAIAFYRDIFSFWDWVIFIAYTICISYVNLQDGYWNGYKKGMIDRELKRDALAGKWDQ